MKRRITLLFGTLLVAGFAFSGISFKTTSLEQLRAKGIDGCAPASGSNCIGAGGIIFINYEFFHI